MEPSLYTTTKEIVQGHFSDLQRGLVFQDSQFKIEAIIGTEGDSAGARKTEIRVDVQRQIVMVYSSIPGFHVSGKEQVKRLVRFMARINELLYFGNLEYNFDTAETRYKTSQIFQGISDPRNSIQFLLNQHRENFPKLATALRQLQDNPLQDLLEIANSARLQPS